MDLGAQLAHGVDPQQAIAAIRARLVQVPNVLAVPPYCANAHCWQVYFDTNQALLEVGSRNAWPVPAPQQVVRQETRAA